MTVEVELPGSAAAETPERQQDETPERGNGGNGGEGGKAKKVGKTRKRRPRWLVLTVAAIIGALAIAVLTPLAVGWRIWYQARQNETPRSDAIIVLGAAQYNGRPSPTLEWRLRHAVNLYKRGVAPAIVTVGGKRPGDNFTEADSGRRWLIERAGIPAGKVVSVPVGNDTLESMRAVGVQYAQRHWKSGVIVTDPWHGLRSKKMAEDNGIKAAASPTRSGPSVQTRDTQFNYIVRETGGYLSYVLLGHSVKTQAELTR